MSEEEPKKEVETKGEEIKIEQSNKNEMENEGKVVGKEVEEKIQENMEQNNNYSTQTNKSEKDEGSQPESGQRQQRKNSGEEEAISKQKQSSDPSQISEIKSEMTTQVGTGNEKPETKTESVVKSKDMIEFNQIPPSGESPNNKNEHAQQDQPEVSLFDQTQRVLSKAKQQRILLSYGQYTQFLQHLKFQSQKHKIIYNDIFQQIQKKKMGQYSWYYTLKQTFGQFGVLMKQFTERCERTTKEEKVEQLNKYINMGEDMKDGYEELIHFKKITSNNYKNSCQFVTGKIVKDLQEVFNKYINEMNLVQGKVNEKKVQCNRRQEELKKQGIKITKMFIKANEGKRIEQDFFVQILNLIVLYKRYQQGIVIWGKSVIQLRKAFIQFTENNIISLQTILNIFKTEISTLCTAQKNKYEQVLSSYDEIIKDCSFSKLITLVDADYILSTMEITSKKEISMISDSQFEKFIELGHWCGNIGNPEELLIHFIIKVFSLKDETLELVSTVSGNLVITNRQNSQTLTIINIKNIITVRPNQQGTIIIEERVGLIFKSKRIVTLEFRDGDRAEELMCFLGQGEISG